MNNIKLLDTLLNDEKLNNKDLYSAGPYWSKKNSRATYEIKKKGLKNFRDQSAGIGSSYADNLILDIRNEFSFNGRLVGKLFSLPFLRTIYNGQLDITNNHIKSFLINLSIVYQKDEVVRKLLQKYKFEKTTEFGCIQKFNINGKEYSTKYLNMAHRIDNLSYKFDFKKINSFFEIGGGFGSNINFLITNFPNIKKIIYLDVVPNIYVGTEYLKFFYGSNVRDYLNLKNLNKISFSNNNNLEIFCIPPWQIEKLDVNIDHFHNAHSFIEMPKKIIDNYCKFIKKFNTLEISLLSYGKYESNTTFNPELLNNFFNKKLKMEWKDNLIKEYKRKTLYLTSK